MYWISNGCFVASSVDSAGGTALRDATAVAENDQHKYNDQYTKNRTSCDVSTAVVHHCDIDAETIYRGALIGFLSCNIISSVLLMLTKNSFVLIEIKLK